MRVNIEKLATIGRVHGPRCYRVVNGRIHIVPPKYFRAGEIRIDSLELIPNFQSFHDRVRLFPELNLAVLPIVPAIGDRSM